MTDALASVALIAVCGAACAAVMPSVGLHENSLGMRLLRIEPGEFAMGGPQEPLPDELARLETRRMGDPDEHPPRRVRIPRAFYMAAHEVTNAQYEQFDPSHRALRGKLGFSGADDEAVVFVSWHEATAFCAWLSRREGLPYRLPTEAEWEYTCRAGTRTAFQTGETLPAEYHRNQRLSWYPGTRLRRNPATDLQELDVADLTVGRAPPNAWGLYDMHGNVEEWCSDWYGPYDPADTVAPVGRAGGEFRVTRGGSHSTELYYLRSSNRSGTIPEDRSWLIGFRVVLGEHPGTTPLPQIDPPRHQRDVSQSTVGVDIGPDPDEPFFRGPTQYVVPPEGREGLMLPHNHDPGLVACANGDLLACWYSCVEEPGRELRLLASRLRRGATQWEPADVFWNPPDRNAHCPALWRDASGRLYHFAGLSAAATWGCLAAILRTSDDHGATWSKARLIMPEHGLRHMPVSVTALRESTIALTCDAVTGGTGGTALHLSGDGGETWQDTGGDILGIHASVVELGDGSLLAFGRGDTVEGTLAKSISHDRGRAWTHHPSPFHPIGGGQRLALIRLREGPILLASFAEGMAMADSAGDRRRVSGLFLALSYDDGETWPVLRLVSEGGDTRLDETTDHVEFAVGHFDAEPRGYLSACQADNGVVHLISSLNHYAFNLAWIEAKQPALPEWLRPKVLPRATQLAHTYVPRELPSPSGRGWRFTGSGVAEGDRATVLPEGGLRIESGHDERVRWADDSVTGFGGIDASEGLTAEARVQVERTTDSDRGFDFEVYLGDGSDAGDWYSITVTETGVYWNSGVFTPLVEFVDNHSAMHTYRLAVRADGSCQVYRDGELLGARAPHHGTGIPGGSAGPYIQWGDGADGAEITATVWHVAFEGGRALAP